MDKDREYIFVMGKSVVGEFKVREQLDPSSDRMEADILRSIIRETLPFGSLNLYRKVQ